MVALVVVGTLGAWVYRYVHGETASFLPWPIPSPHIRDAGGALKVSAGVFALVAAVLTAVYSHRKQLLTEGESRRADALEFSRRYNEALTQLGAEAAAMRLGGAYSMARLADEWQEQTPDLHRRAVRLPADAHHRESDHSSASRGRAGAH